MGTLTPSAADCRRAFEAENGVRQCGRWRRHEMCSRRFLLIKYSNVTPVRPSRSGGGRWECRGYAVGSIHEAVKRGSKAAAVGAGSEDAEAGIRGRASANSVQRVAGLVVTVSGELAPAVMTIATSVLLPQQAAGNFSGSRVDSNMAACDDRCAPGHRAGRVAE
jgi:hypothetical protein